MGALTVRRTGAADYGQYVKVLICGEPGAGKTLISSTFPNPLYASAEGGLMSIADRNIPYVDITSSDQLHALKVMLDQNAEIRKSTFGFPIDTIVIDTIDEIQRIIGRERLTETRREAMQLQDFGWMKEQMTGIIRGFRNLDMNVVFLCHLKETTDSSSGKMFVKPGLTGAVADEIAAYVDLALLLRAQSRVETRDNQAQRVQVRYLQTVPDDLHDWIKDRSGKLPAEVEVNFDDDFERISALIYAHVGDLQTHESIEPAAFTLNEAAEATSADEPAPADETVQSSTRPAESASDESASVAAAKERGRTRQIEVNPETVAKSETPAEPEPPTPERPAPTPKKVEATVDTPCSTCGNSIESQDQVDLSRIRFRKPMCKSCFQQAKNS